MSEENMYTEQQVREYGEAVAREQAQEKSNLHSFFTKVIQNTDTTKTGNLNIDELGNPQLSVRGIKELELFSKEIYQDDTWADYFGKLAEVENSTSLSKEGFLLKLSVTNKKELADVTPKSSKPNKGWFKSKNAPQE